MFLEQGITEQNFQCLTNDDLRSLHPKLAVQFDLREFRDNKQVSLSFDLGLIPKDFYY